MKKESKESSQKVLTRACIVTRACRQSNGGSQKVSSQKGTAVGSPKVTRVQGL
jgi:hypothetical protein